MLTQTSGRRKVPDSVVFFETAIASTVSVNIESAVKSLALIRKSGYLKPDYSNSTRRGVENAVTQMADFDVYSLK
jgi:hypothetical protein